MSVCRVGGEKLRLDLIKHRVERHSAATRLFIVYGIFTRTDLVVPLRLSIFCKDKQEEVVRRRTFKVVKRLLWGFTTFIRGEDPNCIVENISELSEKCFVNVDYPVTDCAFGGEKMTLSMVPQLE